jgi:hypothetical protein
MTIVHRSWAKAWPHHLDASHDEVGSTEPTNKRFEVLKRSLARAVFVYCPTCSRRRWLQAVKRCRALAPC